MTVPSPRPEARFWNRIARRYATQPVKNIAAYEHKLERTAAYMRPEDRVLEIGCGTGTTALRHAPRVAHIDALDFSDEMIAIAREKGKDTPNAAFHVATAEDWDDSGYDMVMAHSVLHLVPDVDGTLNRIRSFLKPGGVFVSSTACVRDINFLLPYLLPIPARLGLIPRVTVLDEPGLCRRIENAGFAIEETWRPDPKSAVFIVARAT